MALFVFGIFILFAMAWAVITTFADDLIFLFASIFSPRAMPVEKTRWQKKGEELAEAMAKLEWSKRKLEKAEEELERLLGKKL